MGTTRAAVVLFVDIDEEICKDTVSLAELTRQGLYQAGYYDKPITVNFQGKKLEIRLVDVMEAGMAIGNGYLWTNVSTKAYTQRGIYTDKQQEQLDRETKNDSL